MRSLVIAVVLAGLAGSARANHLKVGQRLTSLRGAVDVHGKPFRLKQYRGKWVVLSFGASWCKPCAKELPAWDKIAKSWKSKVVFAAVDLDSKVADGKRFHNELRIKNMLRLYLSPDSATAAKYGSDHMPTTIVADPHGVIRYVRGGFEKGDVSGEMKRMRAELKKLVK